MVPAESLEHQMAAMDRTELAEAEVAVLHLMEPGEMEALGIVGLGFMDLEAEGAAQEMRHPHVRLEPEEFMVVVVVV